MAEGEREEQPGHLNEMLRAERKAGGSMTVSLLLTAGADPNAPNEEGETALTIAVAAACSVGMLNRLLSAGAVLNEDVTLLAHSKRQYFCSQVAYRERGPC